MGVDPDSSMGVLTAFRVEARMVCRECWEQLKVEGQEPEQAFRLLRPGEPLPLCPHCGQEILPLSLEHGVLLAVAATEEWIKKQQAGT
jgi:hypothetical protein